MKNTLLAPPEFENVSSFQGDCWDYHWACHLSRGKADQEEKKMSRITPVLRHYSEHDEIRSPALRRGAAGRHAECFDFR